MKISEEKFTKIKKEAKHYYDNLDSIYCPSKLVKYYVFISIIVSIGVRFKVVVKEIEGGLPFFWSIYPSWRKETDGIGGKKKILYTGNLEED
ncbi:MAG: hypothetical protein ABH832_04795 [bacterium]